MVEIEQKEGLLWMPVVVRPRCEKVVSRYCGSIGLGSYLPLYRKVARRQRRTVESLLPMFPGYIFVQLAQAAKDHFLMANKVCRIITMDESSERVLVRELKSLQVLEAMQVEREIMVAPELIPGRPVEITSGPFQGMSGIIEQRDKKTRISVNIDLLGQSVTVELDVGELAPA